MPLSPPYISLSLSLQLACFLNTHKRTHRPTYINGPVSVLPRYGVSFLLYFVVPYWYFLFSFSLFFYSTLGCTLFRNHLQTIECCHGNSTTNNNKGRKKNVSKTLRTPPKKRKNNNNKIKRRERLIWELKKRIVHPSAAVLDSQNARTR